ncbi:MAG: class I SAM-dependent methyltransferase [Desulfobacter sp.]|nr:class I SAM-dependent methyltransferase [Desulfobacter sp.]WDP87393.1 MAG: class I SAM-dependent methyltransferase [Desulfobacter sp.]
MDACKKNQDQATMLANRVKKRYKHLYKRYKRQGLEVFRLYDWDIPEIRAVVDWYGGHLVIGEYSREQSRPDWLPMMGDAVAKALNVPQENLHLKIRKAGIKEGTRYQRIDTTDQKIAMGERDLQFFINPSDYVDTGLFSDHRNTRQRVRKMSKGKDFLNLYCYTGAFTCYAAKGGARSTLSVDRSETAITWVKQNLALNELSGPEHCQVQKDTLDFLDQAVRENRSFDLAVVDPPSYSTTKRTEQHFDIAKDHVLLLNQVFLLMRPKATLFFSTNHQNFDLKTDQLNVDQIREITDQTIPEDYVNKRKKIHRCWEIQF